MKLLEKYGKNLLMMKNIKNIFYHNMIHLYLI